MAPSAQADLLLREEGFDVTIVIQED